MPINVLYIAMDQESSKIESMEQWLGRTVPRYQRLPGVLFDADTYPYFYDEHKRHSRYGFGMTRGELGCFLAHRKAWKDCIDSARVTLVLESDVRPTNQADFPRLFDALSERSNFFDILRLHGVFENNELFRRRITDLSCGYSMYQTLGDPMGTGGYVITPKAANTLLECSSKIYQPVDVFLSSVWFHRLRFRTIKPYPLCVVDYPSTIGDDRRRPNQSLFRRLKIESCRAIDDAKRIAYMPYNFLR